MLTGQTTLLVTPRDVISPAARYLKARPGRTYSPIDIDSILWSYGEVSAAVEMDPLLPITQMIHETGGLTSEWSQVPRRNPAGIGVTGVPGAGEWFSNWPEAIMAHIGLLLCYRFPVGEGSADQRRVISVLLARRPSAPRGVAKNVTEMAVKWAADPEYVNKLSAMSTAILAA